MMVTNARDLDSLATDVDGRLAVSKLSLRSDGVERRVRRGWQIGLLTAGIPIWWAFGVTELILPALAATLAWELRGFRLRLPPGFWIWGLFLVWVAASGLMLDFPVPGTLSSEGVGRYLAFIVRLTQYVSVTVVLLYVGNLSERDLPRARVIRWMAWLGVSSVALGVAAMLFPTFEFETLATRVLPDIVAGGNNTARLAQVQDIVGDPEPRPAAPFAYTNAWGNVLSLCVVWAVVAWGVLGSLGKRVLLIVFLVVAAIPIVHSLNRGVWLGITLAVAYLIFRLALRGKLLTGFISLLIGSLIAVVFLVSPMGALVGERFDNPHSNDIRAALADASWNAAEASPIIGAGSTRLTIGSEASIAIGPRSDCPRCGNRVIGSTGQFWLLLIAQGFVGAALYLAFMLRVAWSGRKDHSPLGIAATAVILLHVFYSFFYTGLTVPLTITMAAVGLLWRNQLIRDASLRPAIPHSGRQTLNSPRGPTDES